jgi:hypothetical protein
MRNKAIVARHNGNGAFDLFTASRVLIYERWIVTYSYKYRKTGGAEEQGPPMSNLIKISPAVLELQHKNSFYLIVQKTMRLTGIVY